LSTGMQYMHVLKQNSKYHKYDYTTAHLQQHLCATGQYEQQFLYTANVNTVNI